MRSQKMATLVALFVVMFAVVANCERSDQEDYLPEQQEFHGRIDTQNAFQNPEADEEASSFLGAFKQAQEPEAFGGDYDPTDNDKPALQDSTDSTSTKSAFGEGVYSEPHTPLYVGPEDGQAPEAYKGERKGDKYDYDVEEKDDNDEYDDEDDEDRDDKDDRDGGHRHRHKRGEDEDSGENSEEVDEEDEDFRPESMIATVEEFKPVDAPTLQPQETQTITILAITQPDAKLSPVDLTSVESGEEEPNMPHPLLENKDRMLAAVLIVIILLLMCDNAPVRSFVRTRIFRRVTRRVFRVQTSGHAAFAPLPRLAHDHELQPLVQPFGGIQPFSTMQHSPSSLLTTHPDIQIKMNALPMQPLPSFHRGQAPLTREHVAHTAQPGGGEIDRYLQKWRRQQPRENGVPVINMP